tara:strand:+ start:525 stop:701 length:177 start_codon:yes stop_codon:yes gene_type:complete
MEFNLDKIQEFLHESVEECGYEIELDHTDEELKEWGKVEALDYLIGYLEFERTLWKNK